MVLVEHEYGIFGGEAGEFVLGLTAESRVPVVVTLHTLLSDPSPQQAATLSALCRQAALVMVFTETARQMVVEQGLATADQVRVVPHGAPDVLNAVAAAWTDRRSLPPAGLTEAANELGLDRLASRTVLSTFGLISASKGLELMIRALPPVVAARPDVLYLIAGQTHPEVVKHEGEAIGWVWSSWSTTSASTSTSRSSIASCRSTSSPSCSPAPTSTSRPTARRNRSSPVPSPSRWPPAARLSPLLPLCGEPPSAPGPAYSCRSATFPG